MPGLGETTAFLKRLPRAGLPGLRPAAADSHRCERVEAFGPNPGALTLWRHIPAGLPQGAPLVVVLHGCTQGAEDHGAAAGWLSLADRLGFAVLLPEQTAANNPNRCFNWFVPGDTARGAGEAASIAAMIDHMLAAHRLDADQVYITGLSAGGAMSAVMLAAYPERFAGGAIIAGLPYGAAANVHEALALMQSGGGPTARDLAPLIEKASTETRRPLRLSIWHGDADTIVAPANGAASARQWSAALGLTDPPVAAPGPLHDRETWTSPHATVELVTVRGLGHGTPLAAQGPDGLGYAAPFMLETDVSSTLEIAAFWGLKPAHGYLPAKPAPSPEPPPGPEHAGLHGLADKVLTSTATHVSPQIQAVIAKALKSAGLMR